MINLEQCLTVCSSLGSLLKAGPLDWTEAKILAKSIYLDILNIQGSSLVVWEIIPGIKYCFEQCEDILEDCVYIDFILELYQVYDYITSIVPFLLDESEKASFKIVLHGIRCLILFFEHLMYLLDAKEYINFKKYNVI